jgi:6-phosphogluconolactonase
MTSPQPELWLTSDPTQLAEAAAELLAAASNEAISQRGRFTVALAGGNTPKNAYHTLAQEPWQSRIDWSRTYLFWGDERCVPPDHPDSNYRMAKQTLIEPLGLPESNVFRIPAETPGPSQAASLYEATLQNFFGDSKPGPPRFDLILLGLGDDGHTASLFPGTTAIAERQRLVTALWVEKLDTHRITFTLPLINAGRTVAFLVSGSNKAEVLKRVLSETPSEQGLPAQLVRPTNGRLIWIVDRQAAALLDLSAAMITVRDLSS